MEDGACGFAMETERLERLFVPFIFLQGFCDVLDFLVLQVFNAFADVVS